MTKKHNNPAPTFTLDCTAQLVWANSPDSESEKVAVYTVEVDIANILFHRPVVEADRLTVRLDGDKLCIGLTVRNAP